MPLDHLGESFSEVAFATDALHQAVDTSADFSCRERANQLPTMLDALWILTSIKMENFRQLRVFRSGSRATQSHVIRFLVLEG
jgi:hypothetical protein